jgi:hypothetical protein
MLPGVTMLVPQLANTIIFLALDSLSAAFSHVPVMEYSGLVSVPLFIAMTKWNRIARNDYLIIPVKLVDYRIEIEPQVFTGIGVKPELNYSNDRITATFKSYGEFHLKLHVYKRSNNKELTAWRVTDVTTLEANPAEAEDVWIYDDEPTYDSRTKTIEGYISPRKGYAIHEINVQIDGVGYVIPYRLQIIKD